MQIQTLPADDPSESISRQMLDMMGSMSQQGYYRFSRSVAWEPAVNIQEDENHLYLCVELAGLIRDEIFVEVVDRKLRIRGERSIPHPPGHEQPSCVMHMEINSGPFERIIKLPDRADLSDIHAALEAGFLWIIVSKKTD